MTRRSFFGTLFAGSAAVVATPGLTAEANPEHYANEFFSRGMLTPNEMRQREDIIVDDLHEHHGIRTKLLRLRD